MNVKMPFQKLRDRITKKKSAAVHVIAAQFARAKAGLETARRFVIEQYAFGRTKCREYWTIALLPENSRFFAAASYIPFIGWLFPMYLKEDTAFCQESAKQGFVLAVFFAALPIVLSLAGIVFIPKDMRVLSLILAILIYLSNVIYFILCIAGAVMAIRSERQLMVPVAGPYAKQLRL